ncbi:MAG: nuclear transport factor 2 family protein [Spirochaetota bacterium]
MNAIEKTVQNWHTILKEKDISGLDKLLADKPIFYSPVVPEPQEGKNLTTMYLTAAFKVLGPTIHYTRELLSERDAFLEFTADINGVTINGVDMIHCDADGRISDFKVMVRPLPAIEALKKQMRRELVRLARTSQQT